MWSKWRSRGYECNKNVEEGEAVGAGAILYSFIEVTDKGSKDGG